MKPSEALTKHRDALRELSLKHSVVNPRVYGSAALGNDDEDSDLDLLVDHTATTTLLRLAALQIEAEKLLGVHVDIRTPEDLPLKIRRRILREAVPV